MNIRPFDWRDLPTLHRFRDQYVFLNSFLLLTNGPLFAPTGALFSFLAPSLGIFTYLSAMGENQSSLLFGQVTHASGLPSAQLAFFAPQSALSEAGLSGLVDYMAIQVGARGAMHILAEADEQTEVFEFLRQAGFGIYTRQRIWKLADGSASGKLPGLRWAVTDRDLTNIKFLYANLVPGLVQQVESPPMNQMRGLVYYRGGDLLAYLEVKHGLRGIWVQPFIHPDAEDVVEPILMFLKDLPRRGSRPVYVCVRSYQSWLESILEQSGAKPGCGQGVMVRHMARKIAQPYGALALETASKEPTVPVAH